MTNYRVNKRRGAVSPREISIDYELDSSEFRQINRSPIRESEDDCSVVSKLLSSAVVHALEALLTAIVTPFVMLRWITRHERLMIVLRVILEVLLELIMLIVFAGVSILTAAALIFEEAYNEKLRNPSSSVSCSDSNISIVGSSIGGVINEKEGKAPDRASALLSNARRNNPTIYSDKCAVLT